MKYIIHIFKVLRIKLICFIQDIKKYSINKDYSIDVDDSVMLLGKFYNGKLPLNFRNINGSFTCTNNGLISLKGCPKIIEGFFNIGWNDVSELDYFPTKIDGSFTCSHNPLISFKGMEKCNISGSINCRNTHIESFNGIPNNHNGILDISIYDLPQRIISNRNYIPYIIKEQYIYGIWNSDGSLNKGRFDIMMKEIKEVHKKDYIDNVAQWDIINLCNSLDNTLINIGGYTHYE